MGTTAREISNVTITINDSKGDFLDVVIVDSMAVYVDGITDKLANDLARQSGEDQELIASQITWGLFDFHGENLF